MSDLDDIAQKFGISLELVEKVRAEMKDSADREGGFEARMSPKLAEMIKEIANQPKFDPERVEKIRIARHGNRRNRELAELVGSIRRSPSASAKTQDDLNDLVLGAILAGNGDFLRELAKVVDASNHEHFPIRLVILEAHAIQCDRLGREPLQGEVTTCAKDLCKRQGIAESTNWNRDIRDAGFGYLKNAPSGAPRKN